VAASVDDSTCCNWAAVDLAMPALQRQGQWNGTLVRRARVTGLPHAALVSAVSGEFVSEQDSDCHRR